MNIKIMTFNLCWYGWKWIQKENQNFIIFPLELVYLTDFSEKNDICEMVKNMAKLFVCYKMNSNFTTYILVVSWHGAPRKSQLKVWEANHVEDSLEKFTQKEVISLHIGAVW